MKKILVILGHPDKNSFNEQLCQSYIKGAKDGGCDVRYTRLGDLDFEMNLKKGYREIQELEPDLVKAQEDIKWADHLVIAFPTWWSSFPAILKGFIDRIILPGFAFKFKKDSKMWDKLLKGKSARLLVTMDAPRLFYIFSTHQAGIKTIKNGTLQFCGINPVRTTVIDRLKDKTEEQKKKILDKVYQLGNKCK